MGFLDRARACGGACLGAAMIVAGAGASMVAAGDGQRGSGRLDLGGTWKVTWSDGSHGPSALPQYMAIRPEDPGRYLNVPVPMELHEALQAQGLIDDPRVGLDSLRARWVSEQYWLYHTSFDVPPDAMRGRVWLVFERLELAATILLNGEEVVRHANAFRPLRIEVTEKLRPGSNDLAVAIESGLYAVADRPGAAYVEGLTTTLNKRPWLRQAQYQFIWDWNPRLINVGITGDVALEWATGPRLDQVAVWAEPVADRGLARVTARAFVDVPQEKESAREGIVRARVVETGEHAEANLADRDRDGAVIVSFSMNQPRLWWPRGHGEPALYTLEVELVVDGAVKATARRRFGVRRIEIDRSPHPVEGEHFTLRVNGRPIFCKGGNWVPPDLVPSTVTRERLAQLVQMAVDANFNLLRVWGGGVYASHDLLDLCDEAGLLVWHDFLFACAKYPADDPEFLAEVREEVRWNVRELSPHPSLVVWCGNNEIELGVYHWGYDRSGRSLPDYALYHNVIPRILRAEDPTRPYWPSSPYSPDDRDPTDPTVGDQHPWGVSLGDDGTNFWAYRQYVDRFPNEGGVLGASAAATLRQFLPEDQRALRSFSWEHHDNAVNFWHSAPGLCYRLVREWLGLEPSAMSLDDYALASGLLQAEALGEYVHNYRRRMFSSSAAVFWMYNDSWPATHGWSIVDYYGRRKLAYHPVRRAFRPVSAIVVDEEDRISVYGVNDTPREVEGWLRFGLFGVGGGLPMDETREVRLAANTSTLLADIDRAQWLRLGTKAHGAFAVLEAEGETSQHRLLLARFMDLSWVAPDVRVTREGDRAIVRSDAFVWAATLDPDGEQPLGDDVFDLLPGIEYALPWSPEQPLPTVETSGTSLLLAAPSERIIAE